MDSCPRPVNTIGFDSSKGTEVCNPLSAMRNRESFRDIFAKPILIGIVLSLFLILSQFVSGQTQQQSAGEPKSAAQTGPVIKAHTNDVVLAVTVRDKKGAMVTSLKAGDITLTDDGHTQTIKSFTRESTLPFRLGLLVETTSSMKGALESERKSVDKFVDQMLAGTSGRDDQAFLMHFDSEVELLQDFTSSREKLHRELEAMGSIRQTNNRDQGPESTGDDRGDRGGTARSARGGSTLYDAIYLASDELMKTQEGHKALVVVSNGVDNNSKESLNDAVDAADRAGLAIYTIYLKGEQERNLSSFPGTNRRSSTGSGWPGGGGGYPGGNTGGGDEKSSVDGRKNLEKIATRTGGRFFEAKKKENLEDTYGQIADELRGQYILTFTPGPADKEDGYHKIAVKAGNGDLTVATREGYYAAE
jgi:VWFA-related protein